MNRRGFISAILGTCAATALPSEIWPFRKIFLPAQTIEPSFTMFHFHDLGGLGTPQFLLDPMSDKHRWAKLVSTGVDNEGNEHYFVSPDTTWPKEVHPAEFASYHTIKRDQETLAGLNEYDAERWKFEPYYVDGCNRIPMWPQKRRELKTLHGPLVTS